jgi:nitrile hydratase
LRAIKAEGAETPGRRVALGFIRILLDKGLVTADELARGVEEFEMRGANKEGARIVAKAWMDPEFRALALKDGHAAAKQLGLNVASTKLVIVPSTESTHCLVVCTLCSCYPTQILGIPPAWYKSRSFRARGVREPRKLLAEEFGVVVPENKSLRVYGECVCETHN